MKGNVSAGMGVSCSTDVGTGVSTSDGPVADLVAVSGAAPNTSRTEGMCTSAKIDDYGRESF